MSILISLQLYSVRSAFAVDPWGTLEEIADAGYKYIEAANHDAMSNPGVGFGVSAADRRARIDELESIWKIQRAFQKNFTGTDWE